LIKIAKTDTIIKINKSLFLIIYLNLLRDQNRQPRRKNLALNSREVFFQVYFDRRPALKKDEDYC